jgi:predicted  nucleic acid-binding Zn-ribbon protein
MNNDDNAAGHSSDEDALYGDIHVAVKNAEIDRLNRELFEQSRDNASLRQELGQLRDQLCLLTKEKLTIETNFMALYNTATQEIKRKDRKIAELTVQCRRAADQHLPDHA